MSWAEYGHDEPAWLPGTRAGPRSQHFALGTRGLDEARVGRERELRKLEVARERDVETAMMEKAIALYQPSILVVGVKRTSASRGPHGTAFSLLATSRVPVLCVPAAEPVIPEAVAVAAEVEVG